jgi:signal transduction histidine kinase
MLQGRLQKLEKNTVLLAGIILIGLVGGIDYTTGVELSFSIFYLIPILFVSWFAGRNYGYLYAFISSCVWLYGETNYLFFKYSNEAIPYWNTLVRFGFFTIIVTLTHELKISKKNLEEKVSLRTTELIHKVNEHKKAEEELRVKSHELMELNRKIETIKEEENVKIAREIHDELAQSLTAINLEIMWISKKYSNDLQIVERMYLISSIVNDTIKTVRKISSRLRPQLLDELGFVPAIERFSRELQSRTGIRCILNMPEEDLQLPPAVSSSMFRIFQEAATNTARHSGASNIKVSVQKTDKDSLKMIIKDNGKGMYRDKNKSNNNGSKSLGIIGMRERALILGGKFNITSAVNDGTEIIVNIPLNQAHTDD